MVDLGFYQTQQLTETIARELYLMQGYHYKSNNSMADSPHPTERLMYEMGEKAIEMVLEAIQRAEQAEMEDEEESY